MSEDAIAYANDGVRDTLVMWKGVNGCSDICNTMRMDTRLDCVRALPAAIESMFMALIVESHVLCILALCGLHLGVVI